MSNSIQYLPHSQINKAKWDTAIAAAPNGLIYATSTYLDAMAPGWDALVLEDYKALFPLPWRRKWGVSYLFQPFLTAQLGLFGENLSAALFNSFLQAIPEKFRYLDLSLNHQNVFESSLFPLQLRTNFVLSLQPSYEILYSNYRQNIRRNIKKAVQLQCIVKKDIPIQPIIELAKLHANDTEGLQQFETLYGELYTKKNATTYGVYGSNGSLLASCVFVFSHQRAYYILVGNHPNGRTLGASHLLIDAFIREYSGSDLILDFEGSDIRNLAFFYSSFGAKEEVYPALRQNRLPWWSKWLKKDPSIIG